MAITPVQQNIDKPQATYRDAKKPIKTANLVHPLPAEGHLVHDSLLSIPKFWLKDIAYDVKAVKDGLSGKANDHQTGRLNDVGLKLGGIGIATYLASRTTDPKMRMMEYVGLGAFLASMSLYPLIAINAPSRMVQGYDIGKEYIDDQGRKKSVYQDGNYIPMDMYRGEYVGEDLDIMGDRMGIPRGIKNRNELIKEQARKTAIQNNTLWMLGAGFATPVMTALLCFGLERILTPVVENVRNKRHNSKITHAYQQTKEMNLNVEEIESNSLSKKVEKFLNGFKDKEIPKIEVEKLVNILSDGTDENLKQGIKEDLEKIFKSEKNGFVLSDNLYEDITKIIQESTNGRQNATLNEVFAPTKAELEQVIKNTGSDGKYMTSEQINSFKDELKKIFKSKIEARPADKDYLYMEQSNIIENISKEVQKTPSSFVSERGIEDITKLAKVIGEFKANDEVLFKSQLFKIGHAPETVLARSYKRFEDAIFEVLGIKYKELKQMKESETFTKEIIEKKIEALVQNEDKYKKAIEKLSDVISDMELRLHGDSSTDSNLKDLINAYENNYNNTARRIDSIGSGKFSKTIDKLVKQDVSTLPKENSIKTREDLFKLIDGTQDAIKMDGDKEEAARMLEYAENSSKGVGSSKRMKINYIIERIQGVKNGQYRILHALDVYKRNIPNDEYYKAINTKIKEILLGATSSNHTLKLGTDNNPQYYKDIMDRGWVDGIEKATADSMDKVKGNDKGAVLGRFEDYIKRFRDVIGNNDIDFTKPDHRIVENLKNDFRANKHVDSITRMQKFNLIAQNPIEFFKKASKTRFENQKWLRIASAIGGSVLAATVLTQFCFGKIKNPHNIQKQVSDDKNS